MSKEIMLEEDPTADWKDIANEFARAAFYDVLTIVSLAFALVTGYGGSENFFTFFLALSGGAAIASKVCFHTGISICRQRALSSSSELKDA